MIADVTGLDYILLKDNIEIKKNNKYKTKKNFLIEFDKENNIIIEINKDSYARILINNITDMEIKSEDVYKTIKQKILETHEKVKKISDDVYMYKDN